MLPGAKKSIVLMAYIPFSLNLGVTIVLIR